MIRPIFTVFIYTEIEIEVIRLEDNSLRKQRKRLGILSIVLDNVEDDVVKKKTLKAYKCWLVTQ